MVSSIYDYRDREVECAERIRRERIARIVEAVVCGPILIAALLVMIFI